jgi:ParB-like chromosome segregation protein Spo0J
MKISIDQVVQTHPYPQREKIDGIRENIREEGGIEFLFPISVRRIQGEYHVVDGSHRYLSIKEEGYNFIYADVE